MKTFRGEHQLEKSGQKVVGGSILRNSRHLLCKTIADSPPLPKSMKLLGSDLKAFIIGELESRDTKVLTVLEIKSMMLKQGLSRF